MIARSTLNLVAARVLGITSTSNASLMPPSSRPAPTTYSAHAYLEEEPTVAQWLGELVPSWTGAVSYIEELFPSASWVRRYNVQWLLGDVVSGVTVALVVVPPALAYAGLAYLDPAFGLYTFFTGAATYWIFGTSKDIVIGVRLLLARSPDPCHGRGRSLLPG